MSNTGAIQSGKLYRVSLSRRQTSEESSRYYIEAGSRHPSDEESGFAF
jgi:hypothetical protein